MYYGSDKYPYIGNTNLESEYQPYVFTKHTYLMNFIENHPDLGPDSKIKDIIEYNSGFAGNDELGMMTIFFENNYALSSLVGYYAMGSMDESKIYVRQLAFGGTDFTEDYDVTAVGSIVDNNYVLLKIKHDTYTIPKYCIFNIQQYNIIREIFMELDAGLITHLQSEGHSYTSSQDFMQQCEVMLSIAPYTAIQGGQLNVLFENRNTQERFWFKHLFGWNTHGSQASWWNNRTLSFGTSDYNTIPRLVAAKKFSHSVHQYRHAGIYHTANPFNSIYLTTSTNPQEFTKDESDIYVYEYNYSKTHPTHGTNENPNMNMVMNNISGTDNYQRILDSYYKRHGVYPRFFMYSGRVWVMGH
jgi:hypothetical protein